MDPSVRHAPLRTVHTVSLNAFDDGKTFAVGIGAASVVLADLDGDTDTDTDLGVVLDESKAPIARIALNWPERANA